MAASDQSSVNLLKAGRVSLNDLQQEFADATSGNVTIENWDACYSSNTGQLSEYCTVNANAGQITGIGLLLYSADGTTMYCAQYTNGFASDSIATSVGTSLYSPSSGNQVLGVVYGWLSNGTSFYSSQVLAVGSC